MFIKPLAAKIFAKIVHHQNQKWVSEPVKTQQKVFQQLIHQAQNTSFGKDHHFESIKNHHDFVEMLHDLTDFYRLLLLCIVNRLRKNNQLNRYIMDRPILTNHSILFHKKHDVLL